MACIETSILIAERTKHENSTRDNWMRIGLDFSQRRAIYHCSRRPVAATVDRRQIPLECPSTNIRFRESRRRLFLPRWPNHHLSGGAAGVHVLSNLQANT